MKEIDKELMADLKAHLESMPDIPKDKKYWGKEYTSKCPYGGTITAYRNTYNGHIHASCDKCDFRMME